MIHFGKTSKSLDGMYSTKEKITLYNTDNKIYIGDRTGFVSDEKYIRNKNVMQPVYISGGPAIETVLVSKNDTVYCKSKSLDAIDQKIMDFLIDEYKKIMYFQDDQLNFPLSKISMVAFNNANNRLLKRTQERLTKMSTHGFKVYEEESNSINDYEIVNMFESELLSTYRSGSFLVNIPNGTSLPKLTPSHRRFALMCLKNPFNFFLA